MPATRELASTTAGATATPRLLARLSGGHGKCRNQLGDAPYDQPNPVHARVGDDEARERTCMTHPPDLRPAHP
ncbi:hypothetical protein, partial [Streptomyces stelliscabiei]